MPPPLMSWFPAIFGCTHCLNSMSLWTRIGDVPCFGALVEAGLCDDRVACMAPWFARVRLPPTALALRCGLFADSSTTCCGTTWR